MTIHAYAQFLRGYAQGRLISMWPKHDAETATSLNVEVEADPDAMTIKLWGSAQRYRRRSGFPRTPPTVYETLTFNQKDIEDNLCEGIIDRALYPQEAQSYHSHPVADAIAAMRTGAPYIGGDRH